MIVKAGTGANIYYYPGGSMGDTGLVAYANKGISHATFCYSEGNGGIEETLTVTKTAVTSYTRTHKWSIDKSVATEDGWTHEGYPKIWLYTDGSGDETATWTVDVTYEGSENSNWVVSGDITIQNTGTESVVITGINDVLDGTPITVTYPVTLPYTLAAGNTLTCTYSKEGKVEGYNEVVVEFNAVDATTDPFTTSATAEIVWGEPTTEVDKTVTVKDQSDLFGEVELGTATAPNDASFIYTKDFAWEDYKDGDKADYIFDNTATIVETGEYDDATLWVNVQPEVMVTKTAETSYTREHFWNIDKSVATEDGWTHEEYPKIWLYTDGSGDETATWTVDVTYGDFTDSDWKVSGTITITNEGPEMYKSTVLRIYLMTELKAL